MDLDTSLDDQIILALRRISQAVDTYSRYLWLEHGLTAPQLGTLRELERHPQATPTELAEYLHINAPTVAGILKRLESRALVTRVRDSVDRRSFVVQLTEKGLGLCCSAPSLLRDRFRQQLERLELWERTQILAMLQRVGSMMGAEDVKDAPFFFNEQNLLQSQHPLKGRTVASMATSPPVPVGEPTTSGGLSPSEVAYAGPLAPRRSCVSRS